LPAERNYSASEREALACLWACKHWHFDVYDRQFTLITDHEALQMLLSSGGSGHHLNTETAVFSVMNDTIHAINYYEVTALVLLDLCAAFNDLTKLDVLNHRFAIEGVPLVMVPILLLTDHNLFRL